MALNCKFDASDARSERGEVGSRFHHLDAIRRKRFVAGDHWNIQPHRLGDDETITGITVNRRQQRCLQGVLHSERHDFKAVVLGNGPEPLIRLCGKLQLVALDLQRDFEAGNDGNEGHACLIDTLYRLFRQFCIARSEP